MPFLLIIVACLLLGAGLLLTERDRAVGLIAREDQARDALLCVREAQAAYHEQTGRYGWVEDLETAGLLDGLEVVSDAVEGRSVRAEGYRIDVLLPHARLGPGVVGIGPRGGTHPSDPDLARRHFAIVARPLKPGVTGYRMWYVDEHDELYLNEGVLDDEGVALNQLPTTQVIGPVSLDTASFLLWQRASEVPPVDD